MKIENYIECVKNFRIPPEPPDCSSQDESRFGTRIFNEHEARSICCQLGMWPIVDGIWTKELASWIGKRKVLEVMAGGGWIAKALSTYGVKITATDDFSWYSTIKRVHKVKRMSALEAVRNIKADILLVSWPPYQEDDICDACAKWSGSIIYIGEPKGGCNATDRFFENFTYIPGLCFSLKSWSGIHDRIMIGTYNENI